MNEPVTFTTSDAWLLLAIAIAAAEGDAPLTSVIAAGEVVRQAVFTPPQLRRGTATLASGGLVRYERGRFSLTEAGFALCDSTTGPPETRLRQLSGLLGAEDAADGGAAHEEGPVRFPELTDGAVEVAIREAMGADDARDGAGEAETEA